MKRPFEIYKNYVCHRCYRQLTDCECELLPWDLIMVDELIQPHVRILNKKGYSTKSSCQAHQNGVCYSIYVSFNDDYEFPPLPNGFKYHKRRRTIYYDMDNKLTEEQYALEQKEYIKIFLDWCEGLPPAVSMNRRR